MADWNVELPAEAVEGAETHVEDHNAIVDAVKEVRTNVDEIELTPGEDGHSPEITWDSTTIVVDGSAGQTSRERKVTQARMLSLNSPPKRSPRSKHSSKHQKHSTY